MDRATGDEPSSIRARRGVLTAATLALFVTAGVLTAPPGPPAAAADNVGAIAVDPDLWARLGEAPVPALLSWDRRHASRTEVARYLRRKEITAHVFERLSMALVCVTGRGRIEALAAAPGAESLWADHPLEPALAESVPTAFNGDPEAVWSGMGITGEGVGIAVVDTGLDGEHPDLDYDARIRWNVRVLFSHRDLLGPASDPCIQDEFTDEMVNSERTSGHGTHIAGVAAGDGTASDGLNRGVAPGAFLVGMGVTDTVMPHVYTGVSGVPGTNTGVDSSEISLLGAAAGINYTLRHNERGRVKVILAGWINDAPYLQWHPLAVAAREASYYGVSVVFPAGNSGSDQSDCSARETCYINHFSAEPSAITVAATPRTSRTELEPYSSRGDPASWMVGGKKVTYQPTLAAPGTGVESARSLGLAPYIRPPTSNLAGEPAGDLSDPTGPYVALTGTSVAAGHVAGAIALMQEAAVRSQGCFLRAGMIKDLLSETATPMPGYEPWEVGAGALDITAAIEAAREAIPPPSPDPWMCPGVDGL